MEASGHTRKGPVLALILVSYLMIVLDISITITALPKIDAGLHFSPTSLSWVQNAYTLAFGGLLLVAARVGASLGLILGGVVTDLISWRVGFFINLPIGITMIVAARGLLRETTRRSGELDIAGGIASTVGMTALVYGIVHAAHAGWSADGTLGALALSVLLIGYFVVHERGARQPIMPLRLFHSTERSGAYAARILFLGAMMGFWFFLTQYLQLVKGFSPLAAGAGFLPMTVVNFLVAISTPRLTRRYGNPMLLVGGLAVTLVGMFWLSRRAAPTSPRSPCR